MSLVTLKEARINLAINALNSSRVKSIRSAERTFRASKTTVINRIKGRIPRTEFVPKSRILTILEEQELVKYLLDRDDSGFGLKLAEDSNAKKKRATR